MTKERKPLVLRAFHAAASLKPQRASSSSQAVAAQALVHDLAGRHLFPHWLPRPLPSVPGTSTFALTLLLRVSLLLSNGTPSSNCSVKSPKVIIILIPDHLQWCRAKTIKGNKSTAFWMSNPKQVQVILLVTNRKFWHLWDGVWTEGGMLKSSVPQWNSPWMTEFYILVKSWYIS